MIIGTCSICRGPVEKNFNWGTLAKCQNCGAVPKANYGPVIPMEAPEPKLNTPNDWKIYLDNRARNEKKP